MSVKPFLRSEIAINEENLADKTPVMDYAKDVVYRTQQESSSTRGLVTFLFDIRFNSIAS